MPTPARRTWTAIVRLLERDERVFAALLAVVMVGGLSTLGLALRPRFRIDLPSLVFWFAAYKVGILALVSVNPSPRKTSVVFSGALAVDLLLIFALLYLTGGYDSLFYLLFFPLIAVNAYYFGPWIGLGGAVVAGLLYAAAAVLTPPWVGWNAVLILIGLVGLPALAVGMVANRERRARAAGARVTAQLAGAPPLVESVRPLAPRQDVALETTTDQALPPMAIDRTLLRQAVLNLVKNGLEALGGKGRLTVSTRRVDDHAEIAIIDTGPGIKPEVAKRLFEQFFTTKPQGTGLGLYIARQIIEGHGGTLRWESPPGQGTAFTASLPIKRAEDV